VHQAEEEGPLAEPPCEVAKTLDRLTRKAGTEEFDGLRGGHSVDVDGAAAAGPVLNALLNAVNGAT
jgi:hypothetical protein